jgi:hypothetical protein
MDMILSEPIMLFDVFAYFPGARHSGRKRYQISLADFHRFFPFGCHNHIAFQKITDFLVII